MRIFRISDMVGNTTVLSLLGKSLHNGTTPKFVILSGAIGTGKSSAAESAGLRLTCQTSQSQEPCLECASCKSNIQALQTTGRSMNLVKVNLALLDTNKDVTDIIREIFHLRGAVGNNVYIIEEFQSLKDLQQMKFLEEIDRLSENTFVFLPTNKPQSLIPDIKSRALNLHFNRLNDNEASLLFDRTVAKLGLKKPSSDVKRMVVKYSRGTARDMVKLIEFIANTQPTDDQIRSFLNMMDNSVFLGLFFSTKQSMFGMADAVDRLLRQYPLETVLVNIKEFLFNAVLNFEGEIRDEFTKAERETLKQLFTEESLSRTLLIFEKLNIYNCTEIDFKLTMMKVRQSMIGKRFESIISDNKQAASAQSLTALETYKEEKAFRENIVTNKDDSEKLSLGRLKEFERKE